MPSTSKRQAKLMAACAHDPEVARKAGVPQKIAREYNEADRKTGILRKPKAGKAK